MRVFNALDGSEVKAIVLREIEAAMSANEQFGKHLTYPLVEWTWEIRVKAHAQENGEFGAASEFTTAVKHVEPVALVLSGTRRVTRMTPEDPGDKQTPDQARADAGLPVPEVVGTPLGLVDEPPSAFKALMAQKAARRP